MRYDRRECYVARDAEWGVFIYFKILTSQVRKTISVASFLVNIWIRDPHPQQVYKSCYYNYKVSTTSNDVHFLCLCRMGLDTNIATNYDTVTSILIKLCTFANNTPKSPVARPNLSETERSLSVKMKSDATVFFIPKEPTVTRLFLQSIQPGNLPFRRFQTAH